MTEPDVTLTDYALALESILFLTLFPRGIVRSHGLQSWFSLFFASAGVASLCGGTVHGFFLDQHTMVHAILWRTTLLAIGMTTLAVWMIAGNLLFSKRVTKWVFVAAFAQFVCYSIVILVLTQEFRIAILDNLPAVVFLLFALALAYRRKRHSSLLVASGGPALTLVAAFMQQLGIGIHPVYFNHNALYHVIQAIGLLLFFLGGRRLVAECPGDSSWNRRH